MNKPKLLDLMCGAGGAARGYQMAGFHVTGVDNRPQPRYAGDHFIQADALEYVAAHGHEFDAIHASPPCQAHSVLKNVFVNNSDYQARHIDLVSQTRQLLVAIERPWVIENVPGAPLCNPILLCGAMFGLRVYRHRLFEMSQFMLVPSHLSHDDNVPPSGHGRSRKGFISIAGSGGFGVADGFRYACDAMGIDWMSRAELSQAVPPAYTEWIGLRLMEAL